MKQQEAEMTKTSAVVYGPRRKEMTNETNGTCQFCEKVNGFTGSNQRRKPSEYDGKVKYGTRHYAHYECFLEHKGQAGFEKLHDWQQRQFPYRLLVAWGLIKIAQEAS